MLSVQYKFTFTFFFVVPDVRPNVVLVFVNPVFFGLDPLFYSEKTPCNKARVYASCKPIFTERTAQ